MPITNADTIGKKMYANNTNISPLSKLGMINVCSITISITITLKELNNNLCLNGLKIKDIMNTIIGKTHTEVRKASM